MDYLFGAAAAFALMLLHDWIESPAWVEWLFIGSLGLCAGWSLRERNPHTRTPWWLAPWGFLGASVIVMLVWLGAKIFLPFLP
jgi:hypothetical protein